jgi:hypothetical protein
LAATHRLWVISRRERSAIVPFVEKMMIIVIGVIVVAVISINGDG